MKKLFDFGEALKALKGSCCVARQGCNEKGRFVCKQVPSHIGETIIPKMSSLPQSAKNLIIARKNKSLDYNDQMIIVHPDGNVYSWVPSGSDCFAEDWYIVENTTQCVGYATTSI